MSREGDELDKVHLGQILCTHIHELGWLPPRSRTMAGQKALAFLPVAGEGREIGADKRVILIP